MTVSEDGEVRPAQTGEAGAARQGRDERGRWARSKDYASRKTRDDRLHELEIMFCEWMGEAEEAQLGPRRNRSAAIERNYYRYYRARDRILDEFFEEMKREERWKLRAALAS